MNHSIPVLSSVHLSRTIAIYGGAFDPITQGHLCLISEVLASELCDEVWLVPSGNKRYDKVTTTSIAHRIQMCELALEDMWTSRVHSSRRDIINTTQDEKNERKQTYDEYIKVISVDIESGFTPTSQLFRQFRDEFPKYDFKFLLGSELLGSLEDWVEPEFIFSNLHALIAPRTLEVLRPNDKHKYIFRDSTMLSKSPRLPAAIIDSSGCGCYDIPRNLTITPTRREFIHRSKCISCELWKRKRWTMQHMTVASTEVRYRLLQLMKRKPLLNEIKISLMGLLSPTVIAYIAEHQLYTQEVVANSLN